MFPYNKAIGNGYVMIPSVRGANADLKNFILNDDGYTYKELL